MTVSSTHVAGTRRLFFALQPDAGACSLLATLADEVVRRTAGRATRAQNLHVTVAFLGSVPGKRIDDVRAIGARVASSVAAFTVTLERLGTFRAAGIAWTAPTIIPPSLQYLFDALINGLRSRRLRVEDRAFQPHVTLARRCTKPLDAAAMPPIAWRVEELVLMSSQTLPEAPRYAVLASWPLTAGRHR